MNAEKLKKQVDELSAELIEKHNDLMTKDELIRKMQADMVDFRFEYRVAIGQLSGVQVELGKALLANQENANKWREKIAALDNELRIAQKGMSSGCGCPIGRCLRRSADKGGCWMQWAEGHIHVRLGGILKEQVMQAGNHPSRFREAIHGETTQDSAREALSAPAAEGDRAHGDGTPGAQPAGSGQ